MKHAPKAPAPTLRCCGKNRYPSKQLAQLAAEEQSLLSGLELDIYRCQCGCGDWHLTRIKTNN